MYTADGLEHNQRGTPSSRASDHREHLDKRLRKITAHDFRAHWAELSGDGDMALLTWGSCSGAVREAATRLEEAGVAVIAGTSFGAHGEGYLRFSYANSIDAIREAMSRIRRCLA